MESPACRCKEGIRGWQIPVLPVRKSSLPVAEHRSHCKGTAEWWMAEVSENQAKLDDGKAQLEDGRTSEAPV